MRSESRTVAGCSHGSSRMTPRRLLYLVNDAAFFVSHRLTLAMAARDAGYDVHVASDAGVAVQQIRAAGLVHHVIPLSRSGTNPIAEFRTAAAIHMLYRQLRPALVHLVTIKPILYGGALARLNGVPRIVAAISGFGFVFLSTGLRAALRRRVVIGLYRIALRHRRLTMIFQNPQDRLDMLRHVGLPDDHTVLIPGSGVDLALFREPVRDAETPLVVMASRLLRDKGVHEFITAAMLLRARGIRARLVLAGSIDAGNPASVAAADLGTWRANGAVELLGQCDDIPALFSRADIVVLPSYREGLPKVLAEAAAASCAVVTTEVPGCRDAIIPEVTGLLVPAGDSDALAAAIERLVLDRTFCAQLGNAGRVLARQRFSLDAVITAHLQVYEHLFTAA